MSRWIILHDGARAYGPTSWHPAVLRDQLGLLGHSVSVGVAPGRWRSGDGRTELLPCSVTGDDHDPATQTLGDPTVSRDGDAASAAYSPTDKPLAEVKAWAVARINREAGEQRAQYITTTIGQEGTYVAKLAEVERYEASPAGSFPYLEAEAAATGSTVADVAALIRTTADQWTALNAGIEGKRRGALVAVDAAASVSAVRAIFPIAW